MVAKLRFVILNAVKNLAVSALRSFTLFRMTERSE